MIGRRVGVGLKPGFDSLCKIDLFLRGGEAEGGVCGGEGFGFLVELVAQRSDVREGFGKFGVEFGRRLKMGEGFGQLASAEQCETKIIFVVG